MVGTAVDNAIRVGDAGDLMPIARPFFNAAHPFTAEPQPPWVSILISGALGAGQKWNVFPVLHGDRTNDFKFWRARIYENGIVRPWDMLWFSEVFSSSTTHNSGGSCSPLSTPNGWTDISFRNNFTGDTTPLNLSADLKVEIFIGSTVGFTLNNIKLLCFQSDSDSRWRWAA